MFSILLWSLCQTAVTSSSSYNAYGCFNIQLAFHTSCSSSARKTCECTINCFMKWSLFSYLQKLHWSILLFNRWLKKFWPEKTKGIFCFCILSKFIWFWCTLYRKCLCSKYSLRTKCPASCKCIFACFC